MTEYTSSNRIIGTLIQIKEAIKQLQDWNKDVQTVDDYYCTPEGFETSWKAEWQNRYNAIMKKE